MSESSEESGDSNIRDDAASINSEDFLNADIVNKPDCFISHLLDQMKISDQFYQLQRQSYIHSLIDAAMTQANKTIALWRQQDDEPYRVAKIEAFVRKYQQDLLESIQYLKECVDPPAPKLNKQAVVNKYWSDEFGSDEAYEQYEGKQELPDHNVTRLRDFRRTLRVYLARLIKSETVNTGSLEEENPDERQYQPLGWHLPVEPLALS